MIIRQFFWVFIASVVLMASFACSDSVERRRMGQAEGIMQEHPDSALSLLESLDRDMLTCDYDRALYGLLYTQALDKNYLQIENDSIISFAVDYFRANGDEERLMKSLYYHGIAKLGIGNYPVAVVLVMQAMDIADRIGDKFWAGMSARGVADVYTETYNSSEELMYAEREYENFKAAGIQPHLNFALLDLERAYNNMGDYNKACEMCEQVEELALSTGDTLLHENCLRASITAYIGNNESEKSVEKIRMLCDNGWSTLEDSTYMVVAYSLLGETDSATDLFNKISCLDSLRYNFAAYHLTKAKGKESEALKNLEILHELSSRIVRINMNSGLISSVADYYKLSNESVRRELEISNRLFWCSLVIGGLVIVILGFGIFILIKRQQKATEDKILFAEQLQEMHDKNDRVSIESNKKIKELLASRYGLLDDLCVIVRGNDVKSAKNKIVDTVSSLINGLSIDGEKIRELKQEVDTMHDGLMTDFEKDLPGLKDADYCLFLFSVLGFSNTAIALLLKEDKINSVYDRKRRLKDRIRQLKDQEKERYLSFL